MHLVQAMLHPTVPELSDDTETPSVYHEFDRNLNATNQTIMADDVLHCGVDYNVANMSAVIHVLRGDIPHAVFEFTGVFDTPTLCRILKETYPSHRILIYPDASGNARKSNNASESDHSIMRSYGLHVLVNSKNPFIKDRILSFNKMINNQGERKYFVNVQYCPMLVESLEKQAYDVKTGDPDKKGGLDHVVDAAFLSIPAWVKRVTVMLNGVSLSGTSYTQIQLGTSAGFVTSGYSSGVAAITSASAALGAVAVTTGLYTTGSTAQTDTASGGYLISNFSGNIWTFAGTGVRTGNVATYFNSAAPQSLSGALTQVRVITGNGTDTFDAGSVNILYE